MAATARLIPVTTMSSHRAVVHAVAVGLSLVAGLVMALVLGAFSAVAVAFLAVLRLFGKAIRAAAGR